MQTTYTISCYAFNSFLNAMSWNMENKTDYVNVIFLTCSTVKVLVDVDEDNSKYVMSLLIEKLYISSRVEEFIKVLRKFYLKTCMVNMIRDVYLIISWKKLSRQSFSRLFDTFQITFTYFFFFFFLEIRKYVYYTKHKKTNFFAHFPNKRVF